MTLETSRSFSLGTVLTITAGRLLTEMSDVYEILGFMTRDEPFTHQLPRFLNECKPWLVRWFPELSSVDLQLLDQSLIAADSPQIIVECWLRSLLDSGKFKDSYDVRQIPRDDHEIKDPYDELVQMRGTDEE